jgi:hypothetical protein
MQFAHDTHDLLRYVAQGSDEWRDLTRGERSVFRVTASRVPDIVGVGYHTPYQRYLYDTGEIKEDPANAYTRTLQAAGVEQEPEVVARFEQWWTKAGGAEQSPEMWVDRCGTFTHPEYCWLGASPDRRLYFPRAQQIALLEVKARQEDRDAAPPTDNYYVQVQTQLACMPDAACAYFVSANTRSPWVDKSLVVCHITYDDVLFRSLILPRIKHHLLNIDSKTPPPKKQTRKPTAEIEASRNLHCLQLL